MGNTQSVQQQQSNNKHQPMMDQSDSKEDEEYAARCSAKQKELEGIISDIEKSIKNDRSMPNLIHQFSRIIELEGHDKMVTVQHMVKAMDGEWKGIFKDEKAITEIVGKDQVAELKSVRCEYFLLLLSTRDVMVGLMEKCKIQKENVEIMSGVAHKAKNNGRAKLNDIELADYDDGIKILTKWIDESDLKQLITKWNDLCKTLEDQKSRMQKLFEKYKQSALWKRIAIGFGVLIGLAAIIGLIIATSGAGAAIAAGTVKTISVGGIKIVTTHAIVAGMSLSASSLICAGGFAYGYYVKPDKMARDVQRITNALNEYIKNCEAMQHELNKVGGVRTQIKQRAEYLDDLESVNRIILSLKTIDSYLDNYVNEGQSVLKVIDEACQEFIKK